MRLCKPDTARSTSREALLGRPDVHVAGDIRVPGERVKNTRAAEQTMQGAPVPITKTIGRIGLEFFVLPRIISPRWHTVAGYAGGSETIPRLETYAGYSRFVFGRSGNVECAGKPIV